MGLAQCEQTFKEVCRDAGAGERCAGVLTREVGVVAGALSIGASWAVQARPRTGVVLWSANPVSRGEVW